MVWLFEPVGVDPSWPSEAKEAFYIGAQPKGVTTYEVSRKKEAAPHRICLFWNVSVSRSHALLRTEVRNGIAALEISDPGSKVGTFIFNAAGARERVDKTMTPVPDVCEIEFGQGSKFKVTKMVIVTSNCGGETASVTATASTHGIAVRNNATNDVTAIVMAERTVTQKAMLGLCRGCVFVTPEWFNKVVTRSADGPLLRRDVDPASHSPPLLDKSLQTGGESVSWDPDVARSVYLRGRHVLAHSSAQLSVIGPVITAAGGTSELLTERNYKDYDTGDNYDALRSGKTCVMSPGKKEAQKMTAKQIEIRAHLQALLKKFGAREIADQDVYRGIVFIDPSFCNPNIDPPSAKRKATAAAHPPAGAVAPASHPPPRVLRYNEESETAPSPKKTKTAPVGTSTPLADRSAAPTSTSTPKADLAAHADTHPPSTASETVDVEDSRQGKRRRMDEDEVPAARATLRKKVEILAPDSQEEAEDEPGQTEPSVDTLTLPHTTATTTATACTSAAARADVDQADEEEEDHADSADKARKAPKAPVKPTKEAWVGPDGTPVIEVVSLVVDRAANKKAKAAKTTDSGKKNFKTFRKGKRGGGVASIARRQVIDVVEADCVWTDEALREMDEENERYRQADEHAAAEEDFVPKEKAVSKPVDKSKRKRR